MVTEHPTDRAGLEILSAGECLRLIASVPVGRVGFVADGEVVVLPVNHVVDGQDPVFRTTRGSKLSAAEQQNVAAFEADHFDEQSQTGWSVLVTGRAEAVYEEAEVERLNASGLYPWASGTERSFWVRIRALSMTGRRIAGTS
ncbi:MAG TPA: pyridoxamine 5'-phosphate oxidase family protein [Streptosporangiaceae bacterium]|nr:pyridoxamine 5'-phosphate oxidase family protein [Streptosporangiaceae bacterium]